MRNFIILSLIAAIVGSCYEKQEGCLDFRASNFDFGADESCEDCCTYPSMRLAVSHEWGDTTLMYDSVYSNLANQNIRILSAQFFLSDIKLTSGDLSATVAETIKVTDLQGNTEEISAAIALIQTDRFNYALGSFEDADAFDGIQFKLGIDGNYTHTSLVTDDQLFDEGSYTYTNFRMEYIFDQSTQDTLQFELAGREYVLPVKLNALLDIPLGINFTIPIKVDYESLLNDVDIELINTNTEKAKVFNNFSNFFNFQ